MLFRGTGQGTAMMTLAESGYWVDHWWFPLVLLLCSPLLLVVGCAYFVFCEKIDKYRSGP